MSKQLPTRTETGYQLGNLVAENLPARQAQALLFCANGLSEKAAAQLMDCSPANVRSLKQALFYKLDVHTATEAITKAFAKCYLRFASVLMAMFIATSTSLPSDHQQQIARTGRTRPGSQLRVRSRNNGRTNNDGGIYWQPETNELIFS